MIYTLEQLKTLILPILDTLTAPEVGKKQIDAAADSLVRIIKEDREAHDAEQIDPEEEG